jgi:hypothetical protein
LVGRNVPFAPSVGQRTLCSINQVAPSASSVRCGPLPLDSGLLDQLLNVADHHGLRRHRMLHVHEQALNVDQKQLDLIVHNLLTL